MIEYAEFLQSKLPERKLHGFRPLWLPACLFDFQRELTEWAIRMGRCALFEGCGLGKSIQELVWAENIIRRTNGNVLLLTPLAVGPQMVQEGEKFGIQVTRTRNGKVHRGINVTNYQQLSKYSPHDFAAVVADECFPAGTLVDTVAFDNVLTRTYIEDVQPGDRIINAGGVDHVQTTRKRQVKRAVRIIAGASSFTCSENHPFFTVHGWRLACDLQSGDFLVETGTAMCLVRSDIPPEAVCSRNAEILRNILLSEMADEFSRAQSQGTYTEDLRQDQGRRKEVASNSSRGMGYQYRENSQSESDGESIICAEDDRHEDDEWDVTAMERRTGREWQRANETGDDPDSGVGRRLEAAGHPDKNKSRVWTANALQDRCWECTEEDSDRGRWLLSSSPEGSRQEEGRFPGFMRVDSIEVLESTDSRLDKYRDADGALYFYDLEASRHPSFSVNGILVHNSSAIKAADGMTRKLVTEFLSKVKYRLLATATPAPNDFMELGTSSEALGVMGRNSMLGMFFTNDGESTQQWRLKGYAKKRFWQWVSSWARAVRMPSDLGFPDGKFRLPPLEVKQHVIPSKRRGLLPELAKTLNEQRAAKRTSLRERCEMVVKVLPRDRPAVAWCQLNAEGDLLTMVLPDAVQVAGSDSDEEKEEKLTAFGLGQIRVLVSKPVISAFGLNWQHCADVAYFPDHSHERAYQAIRRCWRFGQKNPVTWNLIYSEAEQLVVSNMLRKERQSDELYAGIVRHMTDAVQETKREPTSTNGKAEMPSWLLGDLG